AEEGPPQTRPEADRVVDLGRGRDSLGNHVQGLAPQRFLKSVGDVTHDLRTHFERMHADRSIELGRAIDGFCTRFLSAQYLYQRKQIDRVERMAVDDALRVFAVGMDTARQ